MLQAINEDIFAVKFYDCGVNSHEHEYTFNAYYMYIYICYIFIRTIQKHRKE